MIAKAIAASFALIAAALVLSAPAGASTQAECFTVTVQTGVQCNTTINCDVTAGGEDCDPDTDCEPEYGPVQECGPEEVATTPVAVYRFDDGASHVIFSTTDSPPAGYGDVGRVFSLANDGYLGATAFTGLSPGQGILFPSSDTAAQNAIPGLATLYAYYNPSTGSTLYTVNQNDANALPCVPAGCTYNPATYVCVVYPPNCFEYAGVAGLVGR
jgi:hypothetical protein